MVEWCLMRQISRKTESGNHHKLAYVRELENQEKEGIDEALAIIRSFTSNWEWEQANQSVKRVAEIVAECADGIARASGHFSDSDRRMLSRSVIEAASVISSWPVSVLNECSNHMGLNVESRERIEASARRVLSEDSIVSLLNEISQCDDDSLVSLGKLQNHEQSALVPHFQKSSLEKIGVSPADNWLVDEVLMYGLSALEHLAATTLTAYRKDIEQSGRKVLAHHAEIVYGAPVLLPKADLEDMKNGGTNLRVTPIDNPGIEGLMNAVDTASALLQEGREQPTAVQDVDANTQAPQNASEAREEEGEQISPIASNLNSLLFHIGRLNTEIEKAWSSALDPVGNTAHKTLLAQWNSFLTSLRSHISQQDKRGEGHSGGLLTSEFPLTADHFTSYEEVSDVACAAREAGYAELYAVRNLGRCMAAFRKPSAVEINLVTGEETTWWEAGGFSAVRRASELAIRTVHRRDQLVAHSEGGEQEAEGVADLSRSGLTDLQCVDLCRIAMHQGLPEASILYCAMALREFSARIGLDRAGANETAVRIGAIFGEDLVVPAERALHLAYQVALGLPAPLEQIVNLGNFWCSKFDALISKSFDMRTSDHPSEREGGD
ncbi:hypothetical protein [Streptomyces abyssalis]|uniref:hypothetical protein n=1 Tax=Streptomyces abyssalis TaxID=933944 RepID=UPI001112FD36|nr:hypothetical protein [Streptomyces abyssalis]